MPIHRVFPELFSYRIIIWFHGQWTRLIEKCKKKKKEKTPYQLGLEIREVDEKLNDIIEDNKGEAYEGTDYFEARLKLFSNDLSHLKN